MKRTKLIYINIIGTLFLLTACSQKEIKSEDAPRDAKVSLYKIIGVSEGQEEALPIIESEPIIASENSWVSEVKPFTPPSLVMEPNRMIEQEEPVAISENIEYISYRKNDFNFPPKRKNRDKETLNKIIWNAKSFLGTPYVWGATGPNKFDCSGFTQWVYRDVGITIPRVSRDQARVGEYIAYENLRPGDMVFFDTKKHRQGKVTHVGIYLGNGDFIHASSAGKKVVIYNFNQKKYYKERFLWGRRVTTEAFRYALN